MKKFSRRTLLKALAAGAGLCLAQPLLASGSGQRIVIVGGGTGGATAARYLKRALPDLDVTLIERTTSYYTCYLSNEVIGGGRSIDSLRQTYDRLVQLGVNVVTDEVTAIDAQQQIVWTASGSSFTYDRCVVSPGINFLWDSIEGYDATVAEQIPHAWKAGTQTLTLRDQLSAMDDGGVVVIGAPPNPYRCPPAPYERASQIAQYLKRNKPASKVIILDPKGSFAKQAQFEEAWRALYGYETDNALIEWRSGIDQQVVSIDPGLYQVGTEGGELISANVINPIPAQQAAAIARNSGLSDDTGWCPVDPLTFESRLIPNIHVIGDACTATALPKSGYAANSEAKTCAAAIAALLSGQEPPNPSFSNGCFSVVSDEWAISILAVYQLANDGQSIEAITSASSALETDPRHRLVSVDLAYAWYANFVADVFG